MTSRFLTSYRPSRQIWQAEYEVSHHQNCGQDRILVTKIGTFPTLQDAQDAAQGVLRSMLNQYLSRGWSGYSCNQIDLEYRGLIAGLAGEQEYEYLSEIQIHARKKAYRPFQAQFDSAEAWVSAPGRGPVNTNFVYNTAHSTYDTLASTEMLTLWRPASAFTRSQQDSSSYARQSSSPRRIDSFSQTRPQYPDRPSYFIPRASAQYDQTMSFSTPRSHDFTMDPIASTGHARQEFRPNQHDTGSNRRQHKPETDEFIGNALGGGYDIGEPYLGRRHSSIDLPSKNKHFQNTVEEY